MIDLRPAPIAQLADVDIALSDLEDVVTVADLEAVVERQRQARTFWCTSA